jgi:hypothetical protein
MSGGRKMNSLKGTLTISATGVLAALLLTSAGALGQEGAVPRKAPAEGVPLRPFAVAPPVDGAPAPGAVDPAPPSGGVDRGAEELRLLLSDADLDRRMDAFDQSSREAAENGPTRAALELLAADLADPEVAFLARLALRGAPSTSMGGGRVAPLPPSLRGLMGADLFPVDPFGGSLSGLDPFSGDPFRDLEQRMEDLHQRMLSGPRPGLRRAPGWPSPSPPGRGAAPAPSRGSFSSSSVSISQGPGGVRVEVTEDQGEGRETFTYEAESMDALLRAHPELRAKLGR